MDTGAAEAAMSRSLVAGVVVGGGSGTRFGAKKQFADLGGLTVLERTCLTAAEAVDDLVVVLPAEDLPDVSIPGARCVAGGATRADSVRAGLAAVAPSAEVIVVHDAARPLASAELWAAVIEAVRNGAAGAIPALASTDTLKSVSGPPERRVVAGTIDRDSVVRVQTPQAFAAGALRQAHQANLDATDDAALLERLGLEVVVVAGEAANIKITDPEDLAAVAAYMTSSDSGGRLTQRALSVGDCVSNAPRTDFRVGLGYDIHPFGGSGPLILAGVHVHDDGLAGHSDGDAVAHAVADALLGATGGGDIGMMFPATDSRYAGADSIGLLSVVVDQVATDGWTLCNLDVVINAERPKLAAHLEAMKARLAAVLSPLSDRPETPPADLVNIKPKRGEGLGAIGQGQGIACWANVALTRVR